jgi:predicted NUDIX family phosphoesterase
MDTDVRESPVGEVIPLDDLLSHMEGTFQLFSYEEFLNAAWEIMNGYSSPRVKTRDEMVQDPKMQIFIHLIVLFADLYETQMKGWPEHQDDVHLLSSAGDYAA